VLKYSENLRLKKSMDEFDGLLKARNQVKPGEEVRIISKHKAEDK
jgi:hypothetical protein